jgi:GNAT superfamily N-acetyltransferase
VIRDATPADCAALSALAFASKAQWGYDDAFMESCRAELSVTPANLDRVRVRVAVDASGEILGFHGVDDRELVWCFVAADAMGHGVGRDLFADACAVARDRGLGALRIESDPFAAAFYERMGAERVGDSPSHSIPGRALPVYEIAVR